MIKSIKHDVSIMHLSPSFVTSHFLSPHIHTYVNTTLHCILLSEHSEVSGQKFKIPSPATNSGNKTSTERAPYIAPLQTY